MTRWKTVDGESVTVVAPDFELSGAEVTTGVGAAEALDVLLESDLEGTALQLVGKGASGDERWRPLLLKLGHLVDSHEWSSNEAEHDFVSQLADALDVTDSWKEVGADEHIRLLARQLELEVACDIEPDFSAHLSRPGLDECDADSIAEALVQALVTRRESLWGHGESIARARDSLYRFARRVSNQTLRGRLLLEIANIELTAFDQPDVAARMLMLAFGNRWELFEDAVRMFSGYPDFVARLYGSVLEREPDALARLGIRQAMANVSEDVLHAELLPAPTAELHRVDIATEPRFPTSQLFYAESPLERDLGDGPTKSGAPTLARPGTFPADADLEYRFWIDERPDKGIADANQIGVQPPTGTQFPVRLTVDVWSDDVDFLNTRTHITLNQTGSSDKASFRFRLRNAARHAEVLTFVAYGDRVLAVFRVAFVFDGDFVNRRLYVASSHQEHIVACTDWFVFPSGTPSASAITLYMRDHDSQLQIFSREAPYQVWRQLGTSATEFERRAGFIYLEFQRIAIEHAGNKCDIPSRRRRLAQFGQDLLSAFATGGKDAGARDILSVLQDAADGTEVTILTDRSCSNLVVPWGIMTHKPASSSRRKDFWASRFSLCVQPPFHRPRRHAKQPGDGISIATAYEERPECVALRDELEKLGLKSTPLEPSAGQPLAQLETTHFDIVHFFCHGHAAPDLNQTERSFIDVLSDPKRELTSDLSWKFMQGDLVTYLRWGRRTTLLSDLTLNGPSQFAGAPIVILTACESGVPFAGSIGLVRYFLEAGACAVVATEGPVPWEASGDFARQLVNALMRGEPVARAALNARNSLLEKTELFGLAYSVFGNGHAFIMK